MINPETFLKENNIKYILHEHSAVFTCEEAEKHCSHIPGLACKNLLLQNKKGNRQLLLIMPAQKRTDLKQFAKTLGENGVSFASPQTLKETMDLEPGAVSPFGLLNDKESIIEVFIHQEVFNAAIVSFHPNRNTASLELTRGMFHKFLELIKNEKIVINL